MAKTEKGLGNRVMIQNKTEIRYYCGLWYSQTE